MKQPSLPRNVPINEAAALIGVSRTTLYRMWRHKEIELVEVGARRTFVPSTEIERLLSQVKKRRLEAAE